MHEAPCKLTKFTNFDYTVCLVDHSHFRRNIAEQFTSKDSEEADNYHYLSQDPRGGTTGIAIGRAYHGWTYFGSVCWKDQKDRTAITEVTGPDWVTWSEKRLTAAAVSSIQLSWI